MELIMDRAYMRKPASNPNSLGLRKLLDRRTLPHTRRVTHSDSTWQKLLCSGPSQTWCCASLHLVAQLYPWSYSFINWERKYLFPWVLWATVANDWVWGWGSHGNSWSVAKLEVMANLGTYHLWLASEGTVGHSHVGLSPSLVGSGAISR